MFMFPCATKASLTLTSHAFRQTHHRGRHVPMLLCSVLPNSGRVFRVPSEGRPAAERSRHASQHNALRLHDSFLIYKVFVMPLM